MVQQTVKFGGGGVMMWGCMTQSGPDMCVGLREEWTSICIENFESKS
jgi:hypothetical protein